MKGLIEMAQIPQINNSTSKSYSTNINNSARQTNGEQFDILQLTNPMQVQNSTEKDAGNAQTTMGQKNLAPLAAQNLKDPTLAVEVVKDIIGGELLSSAEANGYTELYGELEDLNKTLYLNPSDILKELRSQEEQSTMFSNSPFYDKLRSLAANNAEMRESIANLLKMLNLVSSREEMLGALSSNMRFLSEYFSPNKNLSSSLLLLSKQWGAEDAAQNFEILKNKTASLLKNVSDSLLNDERTQTLIPIVIHNLSKYNTNAKGIADAFSQLLSHLGTTEEKQALTADFVKLLGEMFTEKELSDILHNNYTTIQQKNQAENEIFSNKNINNSFFVNSDKISGYLSEALSDPQYVSEMFLDEFSADSFLKSMYLGKANGMQTIENMLSSMIADESVQQQLSSDMSHIKSMDELINYLNGIIGEMPDSAARQALYDGLDEIINHMALNEDSFNPKPHSAPQSSLEALTSFVEKNINHAALRSVDNFNASNLLQGMINAPGVLTPLSHFIIPIQIEDTKAFGELWVDNERNPDSEEIRNNYHIFLVFEEDTYGRFEVDVYAAGKDVSIGLYYPEGYGTENAAALKTKVARISAGLGYNTKNFNSAVLSEPRSLTEVFPKIAEKRRGMDVQA